MCGIVGMVSDSPVNQRLYDALLLLQHRGQDAAGIATLDGLTFHQHKAMGLVREVFRTRNMRNLLGNAGIAHTRYPTAGCSTSSDEAQPFYVNAPYETAIAPAERALITDSFSEISPPAMIGAFDTLHIFEMTCGMIPGRTSI